MSDCLSASDYTSELRRSLEIKFPGCDPTAFYKDHYFFLPAVNELRNYTYKINYGKIFNPKILTMTAIILASEKPVTKKWFNIDDEKVRKLEDVARYKLRQVLDRTDGTGRYHELLKKCFYFYQNGVSKSILDDSLGNYKNKNQILKSLR